MLPYVLKGLVWFFPTCARWCWFCTGVMTFILGLWILMLICLPCIVLQEVLENCRTVWAGRDLGDALPQLPSVLRSLWCCSAGPAAPAVAAGWETGCDSACSLQSSYPSSVPAQAPLSGLFISFTCFLSEDNEFYWINPPAINWYHFTDGCLKKQDLAWEM